MLSEQIQQLVNRELKKYPADQKQSAVMSALRFVQDEKGWISTDDMADVADFLGMAKMAVYEVATFYHMYNLKPMGKTTLTICTNLSCTLCGAEDTVAYLKTKLGIGLGEVTADGKYGLREGECMGTCKDAPILAINNKKLCGRLTNEKIDQILAELDKS
ncbi:MAG: NAD(P)H-dependent oxidoreductase subunit E [Gallionellaceae bacterium CG1_02_56_997]|nr:NADH-quinone oxidoreductase subunit NuoE [Gallionella sp.]OIO81321.1 MAG: NAD(P)H-dependent oxidoreductase subunit E [Gallionellaceae bacterium CG1_02_56_997]PIV15812.1 MAG: NADH-quinone oxidoreductase subunit NuoE [Gallionellales bacterium CG03_land_8_20_14_0_80_55_15]PIV91744.1 MAG: NADH-quinone oxidoreductase subunit NuoE [Gallionellales bacterium CG17_big_fil_post_rev_8_21_14_2_50_54_146]PJC03487.1 MAG: NADH-quinone oxidoreductase subunit NuoE [Gallionellales bacterium CG_4_9_14_0_8_um_f